MQKLISFVLLLFVFGSYGQEITISDSQVISVAAVITQFETTSKLRFSYDVEEMERTYIKPPSTSLSLETFLSLLSTQVKTTYRASGPQSFALIKDKALGSFCFQIQDKFSEFEITEATLSSMGNVITQSNSTGKAVAAVAPGSIISISFVGRKTIETLALATQKGCKTIYLVSDRTTLNEVVLNNYLTKGLTQQSDGSLELTPSDLGILPGLIEPDIFQSLQLVPGISSPSEDPAALSIRGGTSDQNLVLWDGIKMYQTGHFFDQISAFNPNITKDVSIYRGGTSVRYGDRLSGVVDISSADDLFKDEVGGGFNLTAIDLYLKTPITDNFGVMVAGRRSIADFADTFTFQSLKDKALQNTSSDPRPGEEEFFIDNELISIFSDFNLKAIYKPAPQKQWTLSAIFTSDETLNDLEEVPDNAILSRNGNDKVSENNLGASIAYIDNSSENSSKKVLGYVSNYVSKYSIDALGLDPSRPERYFFLNRSDHIFDLGYDASYRIKANSKSSFLFGQQSSYKTISNDIKEGFSDPGVDFDLPFATIPSILDVVGYGEYIWKHNGTKLVAGIRGGYYNNFETPFLEPRVFASYKFSNSVRYTGSFERKNQSISQLYAPQRESRLFELIPLVNIYWSEQRFDNEEVRLLRSNQATVGVLYNNNGWTLEAEAYYKRIKGLSSFSIDLLTQILAVQEREDIPEGTSVRFGVDFLVKKKIGDYRSWMGISLASNRLRFPGFQEESFPSPLDQLLRFNFSNTYRYKTLEFGFGWTIGSKLPTTSLSNPRDIDGVLSNNNLFAQRLNTYHRLDFSIFNSFEENGSWRGKLGFAVRNAYARRKPLQPFNSLVVDQGETIIKTTTSKSLGLTLDVVLRLTWD